MGKLLYLGMENKYIIVVLFQNGAETEVYSTLKGFVKNHPKYKAQTIRNAFCRNMTKVYKDKEIHLVKLLVQRP